MFKTYTNKCYARTIWHKIFILPGFAFVLCPFSRNKVAAITTYDLHPDYTDRTTVPLWFIIKHFEKRYSAMAGK